MAWTKKSEKKRVQSNLLYAAYTRAVDGSATKRGLIYAAEKKILVAEAQEYAAGNDPWKIEDFRPAGSES